MRSAGLHPARAFQLGPNRIAPAFEPLNLRSFPRYPRARNGSTRRGKQRHWVSGRIALVVLTSSAAAGYLFRAYIKPTSASTWDGPYFLDTHSFRPFTLIEKVPVSSTSTIFRLRPTHGSLDVKQLQALWNRGVWSVQVKQPQLQIVRAYTPLPPDPASSNPQDGDDTTNELRLLIRKEENGEVSGYLHRLPTGSQIEVRRANIEYELPAEAKEVLFLAGGTGIAPAMQLAYAILRRPNTNYRILWANRKREDCLGGVSPVELPATSHLTSWLRRLWGTSNAGQDIQKASNSDDISPIVEQIQRYEQLSKDAAGQRISAECFVDDEQSFIKPDRVGKYIKTSTASDAKDLQARWEILVSGPDGFVEHWAGKKPAEGSRDSQGPLGGILSRLDLRGWKVWKL
ncbi:MAG: mitochondrial Homoaconitase [Bathelium mastoideum]|nr:MAG: mitochondrial Homoaconitase [Bathelium mastoideum]